MSTVYAAWDVELEREVALKVISPDLADDDRFIERFRRESRLAAALEHPAVVPIYEAGAASGVFFIAMRLVRGRDLRKLLAERGPLELDETLELLRPVAAALDAAHGLGLVHRDVKPANVLVSDDGATFLADFGLTKNTNTTTAGLSRTGQIVGTIDYVSPEQIRGDGLDGRSDEYSLACLLFECLTGRPPFARGSELATLWAHMEEVAPLPSSIRPGLPPAVDSAVAVGLAKDPKARLNSCLELLERASAREAAAGPPRAPFVGFAAFSAADAAYFFGRERLVTDLAARLTEERFLALVGASGSGKSSILRAGLLPALARRATDIPLLVRPGTAPSEALASALGGPVDDVIATLPSDARLVVVVDQLEEIFTACREKAERARFVEGIVRVATHPGGRSAVLTAIRADYFAACAAYIDLAELVSGRTVLVGALSRQELKRVVEGPAARAGLTVEEGLTDALLDEVEAEPGALPLLSTALLELWTLRDADRLTLSAYQRSGGVRRAVARLAEDAFASLAADEKGAARGILLRLADTGHGGEPVRRRVPLSELATERADVRTALAALARSRLLTSGDGFIEVAHEALFREWPRLRRWLGEDADRRALRRHITDAATAWETSGRDAGDLLRGARLASALDLEAEHGAELNELEHEYVAASRSAAEFETLRQRRTNRRLRTLLAVAAALLAATAGAFVIASIQRSHAREAATRVDVQRLGELAGAERDLDRSMLLARQAVALDDSAEARGILLRALVKTPAAVRVFRPLGGVLKGIDAASEPGRIVVWNIATRATLVDVTSGDVLTRRDVWRALFTSDSRELMLLDPPELMYLDSKGGTTIRRWRWPWRQGRSFDASPSGRTALAVSRTGRWLVVWDTRSSRMRWRRRAPADAAFVLARFAPDGEHVVTTHRASRGEAWRTYTLWSPSSAKVGVSVVAPFRDAATFALSPDLRTLATPAEDGGNIVLTDLTNGARHVLPDGERRGATRAVAFSGDGRLVATGGDDARAVVWRVASRSRLDAFKGHRSSVRALAFGAHGATLYTAGADGAVIAWDIAGAHRLARPFGAAVRVRATTEEVEPSLAIDPGGRWVAAVARGGVVTVRDPLTLAVVATLRLPHDQRARVVAATEDGRLLAAAGTGSQVIVWETRTWNRQRLLRVPRPPHANVAREWVRALAFAPGQAALVAGTDIAPKDPEAPSDLDGRLVRWRLSTGEATARSLDGPVLDLAFSNDGHDLAAALNLSRQDVKPETTRYGGFAVVFDVPRLSERYRASVDGDYAQASAVAFSPSGDLLAAAGGTPEVRLFARNGDFVGRAALPGAGAVLSVQFASDGKTLIVATTAGDARLVDVSQRVQIGAPLAGVRGGWTSARPSPDGKRVFIVSSDGDGVRWTVEPSVLAATACRIAGRTMTRAEWARFLPARSYHPACRSRVSGRATN